MNFQRIESALIEKYGPARAQRRDTSEGWLSRLEHEPLATYGSSWTLRGKWVRDNLDEIYFDVRARNGKAQLYLIYRFTNFDACIAESDRVQKDAF
jgi:hypothetical protein